MISIKNRNTNAFVDAAAMCGRSAVASSSPLGSSNPGTGLPGAALRPELAQVTDGLVIRERSRRQAQAPATAAKALAYGFTTTDAGASERPTKQHHTMWAFRGLKPWSHPA
ncbi:hypothetical protein ACSMX9_20465 [Streptomyces sp. LE64]|uniref:hypothetical protein n=1 Tax=Streptomyces sp. LE64 TaxID=3448653 RepID=UPI0040422535